MTPPSRPPESPSRPPEPEEDMVAVARIRRARGRRGEVAAEVMTDFTERFHPGAVFRVGEGARLREMTLEECWFQKGLAILKFQGVDSISDAELLADDIVRIPRSQRRELPPGAVYISDLIGCRVTEDGAPVGEVTGFLETGGVPVLQLQAPEGEILIPYAEHICREIDLANREIRVRLPEGLREVNRTTGTGGRRRQRNARRNRNAQRNTMSGGTGQTAATGSAELKEHDDD